MALFLTILFLIISLALIWKGSDWLTDSLIPAAQKMGTSYIAVTTLLVAFALSIPEIFTSIYSTVLGHPNIGLGVIIGSVMSNIGLTVGISASFKPLTVEKAVVVRDGIFLIIATIIVLLFGSDLNYQRTEGVVLLLLFLPYASNVWFFEKWRPHKSRNDEILRMKKNLSLIGGISKLKLKASILTFILGSAILIGGSYLFSFFLIKLNEILRFPELLIGLTIGALGPVLPNIITAVQGTRKGIKDAAITETFGSNIFTLLISLGLIIVLNPLRIPDKVVYFDLTWMMVINFLMIAFIFKGYYYKEESLTRYEGMALILFYLSLLIINILFFS